MISGKTGETGQRVVRSSMRKKQQKRMAERKTRVWFERRITRVAEEGEQGKWEGAEKEDSDGRERVGESITGDK